MKGSDFEQALRSDSRTITEIADLMEIARNNLYGLFRQEEVPFKWIEKAKAIGVKIDAFVGPKPVPYYDVDAAAGNVAIFNEDKTEYIKQYISVPAFADCDMFINISGNSMYPKYCSGELVALKKIEDRDVVAFGEAYVIVTKEQRFLKYIRKGSDKMHWTLCSEHNEYEPFEIPIKKVLHLYIVKGKITKNII